MTAPRKSLPQRPADTHVAERCIERRVGTSNVVESLIDATQTLNATRTLIKTTTWKHWSAPSATAHEGTPAFSDVLI
jgi:hypothetical protein